MGSLESIEVHARRRKKYHPFIIKQMLSLYSRHTSFFKGLFGSRDEMVLFFNAIRNAKVIVLNRDRIASGRRDPAKRKNPCVEYYRYWPAKLARFFRSRHDMVAFLNAMMQRENDRDRNKASEPPASRASGRKTGDTPCFMVANHPVWARGVLNKEGRHVGNTFNLATIEGFTFFFHEAVHLMQWYRSPFKLLFQYVKAVVKSLALSDGHIPWAHELIDFEVEAMVFHNKFWQLLVSWPEAREYLARFEEFR